MHALVLFRFLTGSAHPNSVATLLLTVWGAGSVTARFCLARALEAWVGPIAFQTLVCIIAGAGGVATFSLIESTTAL